MHFKAEWKIDLSQSVLILWRAPQINKCMGNTDCNFNHYHFNIYLILYAW